MSLRFLVHREGQPPREHLFDQYAVIVGRGADADLTLEDPGRVISKRHTEIRRTGAVVKARDLGSKNGTRVGTRRLDTEDFWPVQVGEKLEVGDVLIELLPELEAAPTGSDVERTMFAHDFVNPFVEPANALADALAELRRQVGHDSGRHLTEALGEAVRDAFGLGADAEANAVIALARREAPTLPEAPAASPAHAIPSAAPAAAPPRDPAPSPHHAALPPPAGSLEGLAAALAPLLALPTQFRHEFIGETVMHAPETAFLYDADAGALAAYIAEAEGAEREERLEKLQAAAREVVAHQLGLVEGYRAATQSGIDAFLDRLDPESLDVPDAEGGLARFLPAAKKGAVLDALTDRIEELRQDGATTERRIFRPAFIRAYLALTTAARIGSGLQRETLPDSGTDRRR